MFLSFTPSNVASLRHAGLCIYEGSCFAGARPLGNTGTIALNSICKYMLICAIYHTCLLPLKFWETGCALPNSRNLTTKWSVQGQECRKCGVLQHQTTIMVNRSAKCTFSSQHKHGGGFVVAVTGYGIRMTQTPTQSIISGAQPPPIPSWGCGNSNCHQRLYFVLSYAHT